MDKQQNVSSNVREVVGMEEDDDDDCSLLINEKKKKNTTKCMNPSCCSGKDLAQPANFVLSYFGMKRTKDQLVCGECFEMVVAHQQKLVEVFKERKSLFRCEFPEKKDVNLFDSDEEDVPDEAGILSPQVHFTIQQNLDDVIYNACRKYDIEFQIDEATNILSSKTECMLESCEEISFKFDAMQKSVDEMRKQIYDEYRQPLKNNLPYVEYTRTEDDGKRDDEDDDDDSLEFIPTRYVAKKSTAKKSENLFTNANVPKRLVPQIPEGKVENYRTFGRTRPNSWHNGRFNVIANQIAKNRVKNAVRVLNKMPNQIGVRYSPYRAIKRQTMHRQIGNTDDIDKSGPISISVKNEHALKGLSIQRLAQFNQSNVSPLRRLSVGVSSNLSKQNDYRKKWGPRLDAKVQQTIADEFAYYESVPIPEDDLNDLKCPIKTTCLTLNDRFGSYLPESD